MSMVELERVRASHEKKISLKINELQNVVNSLKENQSQEESQNEEEPNTEEEKPEETNAEEEQQAESNTEGEEEQQEESTEDQNRKYICKRLGLMGYKRSEREVNFDSMPCEEFYQRTDQETVAIDSITVYQGMHGSIGGIRVELTDGNPAFLTPEFALDSYNTEYKMQIGGF